MGTGQVRGLKGEGLRRELRLWEKLHWGRLGGRDHHVGVPASAESHIPRTLQKPQGDADAKILRRYERCEVHRCGRCMAWRNPRGQVCRPLGRPRDRHWGRGVAGSPRRTRADSPANAAGGMGPGACETKSRNIKACNTIALTVRSRDVHPLGHLLTGVEKRLEGDSKAICDDDNIRRSDNGC